MTSTQIIILSGIACLVSFALGLILGASIGAGARTDQEFQEYTQENDQEI